jgi:surface protein
MFNGCSSLISLDLSNFDTYKVGTKTQNMFTGCDALILDNINMSNCSSGTITKLTNAFDSK